MRRRRRNRRQREVAFGLDSFLDIITNVIGIIIRMMIVVWIGSRAYHAARMQKESVQEKTPIPIAAKPAHFDPMHDQIKRHKVELAQARRDLLNQLQHLDPLKTRQTITLQQIAAAKARADALAQRLALLDQTVAEEKHKAGARAAAIAELQRRREKLKQDIANLRKKPLKRNPLRYYAPVSRPVKAEEIYFECKAGRVTHIPLPTFVQDVKDEVQSRAEQFLRTKVLTGVTPPSGSFRLRYRLERRPTANQLFGNSSIDYVLRIEPVENVRGEPIDNALKPQSRFRQAIDFADPRRTVVTVWVYPDSFVAYRRLREYLYSRDLEVAANPITTSTPIILSPHGRKSLGQ